ncbi:glutamate racemase [Oscillospiraceae bacterium CM]|nr:glutamate racemase [Oscillospiraceae bacterium CM]
MLIGFFDSGIGGLTVLHESLKTIRKADYVYYADIDNVPYGAKTASAVKEYVFKAADSLTGLGVGALVIACNTATSVAIEALRQKFDIPIIGMEPAVKPAVENHKGKRILVTATALTLKQDKLKRLITRLDCEDIVDFLPLPGLVEFAEKLDFDTPAVKAYLNDALSPFDLSHYQAVVLGCTHFVFFAPVFKALLHPAIEVIDGNKGTVNRLLDALGGNPEAVGGSGAITYCHSGRAVTDAATLQKYASLLRRLDGTA